MLRELLAGAGLLWRGLGMWSRHPGLMLLGAVPALLVFTLLGALVVVLALNIEGITAWMTPFADDWGAGAASLVRILLGAALLIGAIALGVASFTAVTLVVGEPVYARIWRAAEQDAGGFSEAPLGFWRSAGDAVLLILRGIGVGLLVFAIGLVPVIGQLASPVVGALLNGHVLARELTGRSFEARGITASGRRALLRGNRARELGFGVMTQLCFLVPGGAVVMMPVAVVGATALARSMLASVAPPHPAVPSVAPPASPASAS